MKVARKKQQLICCLGNSKFIVMSDGTLKRIQFPEPYLFCYLNWTFQITFHIHRDVINVFDKLWASRYVYHIVSQIWTQLCEKLFYNLDLHNIFHRIKAKSFSLNYFTGNWIFQWRMCINIPNFIHINFDCILFKSNLCFLLNILKYILSNIFYQEFRQKKALRPSQYSYHRRWQVCTTHKYKLRPILYLSAFLSTDMWSARSLLHLGQS